MEIGPTAAVVGGPHHPYTGVLLAAAFGHRGGAVSERVDEATAAATGCPFHTRCPRRIGLVCDETHPGLAEVSPGHFVRCHLPADALGTSAGGGAR